MIVGEEMVRILNSSSFSDFCCDDTPAESRPEIYCTRSEVKVSRYRSCCSEGRAWSLEISSSAWGTALSWGLEGGGVSEDIEGNYSKKGIRHKFVRDKKRVEGRSNGLKLNIEAEVDVSFPVFWTCPEQRRSDPGISTAGLPDDNNKTTNMTARMCSRVLYRPNCTSQLCHNTRGFSSSPSTFAGHNKWSQIKHDKAKNDRAKGSERQLISKEIYTASKSMPLVSDCNTDLANRLSRWSRTQVQHPSQQCDGAR